MRRHISISTGEGAMKFLQASLIIFISCVVLPVVNAETQDNILVIKKNDEYSVAILKNKTMQNKTEQHLTIAVKPYGVWKLNLDFPSKMILQGCFSAKTKPHEQLIKDAVKKHEKQGISWQAVVRNVLTEPQRCEAVVKIAVCTDVICIPKQSTLSWSLTSH